MKLIEFLILMTIGVSLLFWATAKADKYRPPVNYYETTEVTYEYNSTIEKGVAVSASNDHPFTINTSRLQGSINCARYGEANACSFALAKRLDKTILLHSTFGFSGTGDEDKELYTVGAMWKF